MLPAWCDDLTGYRKLLMDAWSDQTIHESFKSVPGDNATASRGQCGVSSAWLVEVLEEAHPALEISYCYGDLIAIDQTGVALERHCWVEVGQRHDPARLVIDLTGDQWELLKDQPVLCLPHDQVKRVLRVDYRVKQARMSPLQLKYDLVQPRLAILKAALQAER